MKGRFLLLFLFALACPAGATGNRERTSEKILVQAVGDKCQATIKATISDTGGGGKPITEGSAYTGVCKLKSECSALVGKLNGRYVAREYLQQGDCQQSYTVCCLKGISGSNVFASIGGALDRRRRVRRPGRNPASGSGVNAVRRALGRRHSDSSSGEEEFNLEAALDEIDGLPGVKKELHDLQASVMLDDARRELGIALPPAGAPHMVFMGNPGTGKTKIGQILGELLYHIGFTDDPKVVLVKRENLVGAVIGATEKNTLAKIKEAKGGVLFVDEAYQLTKKNSPKDFGNEAVEVIMNCLQSNDPVVVFAGYPDDMRRFMSANEGMRRRVGRVFHFEDHTRETVAKIFVKHKLPPFHIKDLNFLGKVESDPDYKRLLDGAVAFIAGKLTGGVSDEQMKMYNAGIADVLIDFLRQHQNGRIKRELSREARAISALEPRDLAALMAFTEADIDASIERLAASFEHSRELDEEEELVNPVDD